MRRIWWVSTAYDKAMRALKKVRKAQKLNPFQWNIGTVLKCVDGTRYEVRREGWRLLRPSDRELKRLQRKMNHGQCTTQAATA